MLLLLMIDERNGAFGGMRIGRGNRRTLRKPVVHHKSHMN
jgi:hypothetical protein